MVVVDRLSKYAHFAPLSTRFDAFRVAHLFVNTVVQHHGFPKTLVSDQDSDFLNTGPCNFSFYFGLIFNRYPPTLVAAPPSARTPPNVAALIRQRGEVLVDLRRNLQRAQQRMRDSTNKHRRHVEVGDLVWLKLQPYRQYLVAKPISAKLAKRFYGPCEVTQCVGPVAYLMRLPEGSRIHDVFHVSLLREFVAEDDTRSVPELPKEFHGDRPIVRLVSILDSQVLWHDRAAVEHVLVRLSDGSESPSWEPLS